jgi:hypothetical protein
MALKSATMDLSVARPASIEFARFRNVPHCRELPTISGRGCKFTGEVRTIGASPPTQALADSRAGARPAPPPDEPAGAGFRADRPRRRVRGDPGPHRRPSPGHPAPEGSARRASASSSHNNLLPEFADGVWAIELASLSRIPISCQRPSTDPEGSDLPRRCLGARGQWGLRRLRH